MAASTEKVIPGWMAQQIADLATELDIAPLREARIFQTLTTAGYTNEDISGMTGRRACYVGWRLDLFNLTERGQEELDAGRLPVNLAGYIALLSEPNQNLMLARWARGEFTSTRHAERYARAIAADETGGNEPERTRGADAGGRHWTAEEDRWLLDHWQHSNARLGEDLGRTENAIPHRRRALRPEEFAHRSR
ncbi:hypothetical protein OOK58_42305 [Streptomyces sp. NBC_01728]|uniref:hypothetical protein n=1 Tax=unclassified Streptomyces TaxID=2593676 RepID=UPI0022572360|nr:MULTISPECIES: hypothetical protein [unclassified Streptomyces]MCX4458549.1 hypothetical protein [Streptomyces sp. NBC_01719]MCX4497906.1 hypothetical protein [Streptomyces sp. NBC_01728]